MFFQSFSYIMGSLIYSPITPKYRLTYCLIYNTRQQSMLKTRKFEVLDYLKTEKDIREYLDVVLEAGDYKFLPVALADIARARKAMTGVAKAAGVTRTNLYQSFSEDGHPAFETIAKVAYSLGYRLALIPVSEPTAKKTRKSVMSKKASLIPGVVRLP
jgi:probable addiction module antidote protein